MRARDARSFGELSKLPESKECACARHLTIHHRAHLGAVLGPAARKGSGPSTRLPQAPHTRLRGFREAAPDAGLRMRLPEDRRRVVLGDYAAAQTRRVDRG